MLNQDQNLLCREKWLEWELRRKKGEENSWVSGVKISFPDFTLSDIPVIVLYIPWLSSNMALPNVPFLLHLFCVWYNLCTMIIDISVQQRHYFFGRNAVFWPKYSISAGRTILADRIISAEILSVGRNCSFQFISGFGRNKPYQKISFGIGRNSFGRSLSTDEELTNVICRLQIWMLVFILVFMYLRM